MKLTTIIDQIDLGSLALPKFQRGYVWNRAQVRNLMRSLYRGFPVGSLLVWETQSSVADVRGDAQSHNGSLRLLLDGQQRITSLYGIVRGHPPVFFEGDAKAFENLCFNLESEEFEFYVPTRMSANPHWIKITELMQSGAGNYIAQLIPTVPPEKLQIYINRLNAIANIQEHDFHIDLVSGADKSVDVVVDIFNQVNSGGTKLSKGDLALAKIGANWPEAREEMRVRLTKWRSAGYKFNLDWLLRCINGLLTGQSEYSYLGELHVERIAEGLTRVEKHVDDALNLIASRLGLDHHRVLGSPNAFPAIVRYFDKHSSMLDHRDLDRLLFWYIHAMLWGRYSGPIETVIRQDLLAADQDEDPVKALIERLTQMRGHLRVSPNDFAGWNRGSRFYPLLYLLTRVYGTRDLNSGIALQKYMLGKFSSLEMHHIFPKSRLRAMNYQAQKEVNAVANFTFLTKATNLKISSTLPEVYFCQYESKNPGVLSSHWIPMDEQLWKIENYRDFLAARRELLAKAANSFLEELYHGAIPESPAMESVLDRDARPISIASDEEEAELIQAMDWMQSQQLPPGELGYELPIENDRESVVLDLAWPRGIQQGLSEKVALLIDEEPETLAVANAHGFRYFTTLPQLQRYVQRDILGEPAM